MNPLKTYTRTVGQSPWTQVPVEAGAGYMLGRLANRLATPVLETLMAGRPPEEKQQAHRELTEGRYRHVLPTMFAILAGTRAGLAHRGIPDMDLREEAEKVVKPNAFRNVAGDQSRQLFKTSASGSSYDTGYNSFSIPKSEAMVRFMKEPRLREDEQRISGALAAGSEEINGMTSGRSLTTTALNAGASFVPAYIFGRATGRVLGLPDPIKRRAAALGGLAGAVKGSGVVDDILKRGQ